MYSRPIPAQLLNVHVHSNLIKCASLSIGNVDVRCPENFDVLAAKVRQPVEIAFASPRAGSDDLVEIHVVFHEVWEPEQPAFT